MDCHYSLPLQICNNEIALALLTVNSKTNKQTKTTNQSKKHQQDHQLIYNAFIHKNIYAYT